jgi:hypothetical protein
MKWIGAFLLALAWMGYADAQSGPTVERCPAVSGDFRWEDRSVPDWLFCRAVSAEGEELFALTISSDSPFRPQRSNRAETGVLGGGELQWYRGNTAQGEFIREALIDLDSEHKAHIFLSAPDAASMSLRQKMVETLELPRVLDSD